MFSFLSRGRSRIHLGTDGLLQAVRLQLPEMGRSIGTCRRHGDDKGHRGVDPFAYGQAAPHIDLISFVHPRGSRKWTAMLLHARIQWIYQLGYE